MFLGQVVVDFARPSGPRCSTASSLLARPRFNTDEKLVRNSLISQWILCQKVQLTDMIKCKIKLVLRMNVKKRFITSQQQNLGDCSCLW
jgi:hypothetical protein